MTMTENKKRGRPKTRKSEELPGYNFIKLYHKTWVAHSIRNKMSAADEGVYIHLICLLAEYDALPWDVNQLVKYTRFDKRIMARWMAKWHRLFVDCPSSKWSLNGSHVDTSWLPSGCQMDANWHPSSSHFVSPKLAELAVAMGKLGREFITDERRGEREKKETCSAGAENRTASGSCSASGCSDEEFYDLDDEQQAYLADEDCTECEGVGMYLQPQQGTSVWVRCDCTR